LMEARKLGFSRSLVPKSNADRLIHDASAGCMGVRSLPEVLELLFGDAV